MLLPLLSLVVSMRHNQPLRTWAMPGMIAISCASLPVMQFAIYRLDLIGAPDCVALLGSFVASILGNLYSRWRGETAFSVMFTSIWLLIPTSLASAGGLSWSHAEGQDEYTASLPVDLARKSTFYSSEMKFCF